MSDNQKDILEKALEGKASTSTELKSEEEFLSDRDRFSRIMTDDVTAEGFRSGDVRFVGNVSSYSLYSPTDPTDHPRRHRKLVQELLFFGADVYAEGTSGARVGGGVDANKLDTNGVELSSLLDPPLSLAVEDLLLIVSNWDNDSSDTFQNAEVYSITGFNGDVIEVNENLNFGAGRYWQVVKPNPTELLPVPSVDGNVGEETSYLTIAPKIWPTTEVKEEADNFAIVDTNFTADEKVVVTFTHEHLGQFFDVGDFCVQKAQFHNQNARLFYVEGVNFTAGTPHTEEVTLLPFFNTEVAPFSGEDLAKVYTIEDLFPLGAGSTSIFNSQKGSNKLETPILDQVWVRPLVSPVDTGKHTVPSAHRFLSSEGGRGVSLTLYSADASGQPDYSNPFTDFDNITLDSSVEEEQYVEVDYDNGIVKLSHPIAPGSDLNPASYTDADGRAKLFASFVAYNDVTAPKASNEVVNRTVTNQKVKGANAARLKYVGDDDLNAVNGQSPAEKTHGWIFQSPAFDDGDLYHRKRVGNRKGGKEQMMTVSVDETENVDHAGVEFRQQFRSPLSGYHHLGRIRFGHTGERVNQFIFNPDAIDSPANTNLDASVPEFGEQNQYSFRVSLGDAVYQAVDQTTWQGTTITAGVNDTIKFVINDIAVEYILPNGDPAPGASTLATSLTAAINSAASALGVPTGDFNIDVVSDGTANLEFRASGLLYFQDGNGHSLFQLPTNEIVRNRGVNLHQGLDGSIIETIEWYNGELVFDGTDIRLTDGTGLADHETRITTNEGDLTVLNQSASTPEFGPTTAGWLDGLTNGSTFILSQPENRRGKKVLRKTLNDPADVIHKVAVDGNGRIFIHYYDDSAAQYNIGKAIIADNYSVTGSISFDFEITNVGPCDFFECNGEYLAMSSDTELTKFRADTLQTVGSFTASAGRIIEKMILRKNNIFTMQRWDNGGDGVTYYHIYVHGVIGNGFDTSQEVYSANTADPSLSTVNFMHGDNERIYFAYKNSQDIYTLEGWDWDGSSFTNNLSVPSMTVDDNEVPSAIYSDGDSIYVFGDLRVDNSDTTSYTIRRLDRDGHPIDVVKLDDTGLVSVMGVVDHRYIYTLTTGNEIDVVDKDTLKLVAQFQYNLGGVDDVVDLVTDGTWLCTAERDTAFGNPDNIRLLETGDKGGLWYKGPSSAPTYTIRTALYGK